VYKKHKHHAAETNFDEPPLQENFVSIKIELGPRFEHEGSKSEEEAVINALRDAGRKREDRLQEQLRVQHDAQDVLQSQLQQATDDLEVERKAHAERQREYETLLLLNKYEGGQVDEDVGNYYHADALEPVLESVDSSIAALDIITESLSVSVLNLYSILNKLSDIDSLPDADVAKLLVAAKSLASTVTSLAPSTAKLVSSTVMMLSTASSLI
jgi:hypothetical protein